MSLDLYAIGKVSRYEVDSLYSTVVPANCLGTGCETAPVGGGRGLAFQIITRNGISADESSYHVAGGTGKVGPPTDYNS